MDVIYLMWGGLPVVFLVAYIMMNARERKDSRADESAVDPMFRTRKPGRQGRAERKTAGVK